MATGEGVIVLVAAADRGVEPFGKHARGLDRAADDDAGAVEDHRELRFRQKPRGLRDRLLAAGRPFQPHDLRQLDLDHLRPVIARDVDLRRRRAAPRLLDDAVQHFGNARGVAHLFLVADHLLEQSHLVDFLEAALPDRLVRRLRRDEQHRRVVPVGGLDRGDEAGHARPVLRDRHRHLAGGARVAVADQRGIGLVGAVPEGDAGLREKVGDRHHGRADDAEGVADAVHLENLHEGFLGGHPDRPRPGRSVECGRRDMRGHGRSSLW